MAYWLTTHWPPRENEPETEGSGIWLPDGREIPGSRLAPGDLVFVYQAGSGRPLIRQLPDGTTCRIRCRRGREGVVHLGRVRTSLTADQTTEPEQYADGTSIWWRWHSPVDVLTRSGFIPRKDLAEILGYKRSYPFRGFGEKRSGLRELTESEFFALREHFRSSRPLVLQKRPVPRRAHDGIIGLESDDHRVLKEFVAANPVHALGEPGIRTIAIEHPFPTGDRADIVLADEHERIIGVEVEPAVGDSDDIGILQAIKYRRMLEWTADRAPGDSRSMLVAYRISGEMRRRCEQYDVECFEIPRRRVQHTLSEKLRSS